MKVEEAKKEADRQGIPLLVYLLSMILNQTDESDLIEYRKRILAHKQRHIDS